MRLEQTSELRKIVYCSACNEAYESIVNQVRNNGQIVVNCCCLRCGNSREHIYYLPHKSSVPSDIGALVYIASDGKTVLVYDEARKKELVPEIELWRG